MENSIQSAQTQARLDAAHEEERAREEQARKEKQGREADQSKAQVDGQARGESLGDSAPAARDDRSRDDEARKDDARREDDRRKEDDRKKDQQKEEDRRKEERRDERPSRALDDREDREEKAQPLPRLEPNQASRGVGLDEQVAQAKAAEKAPESQNTPSGNLTRPSQKNVLNPDDLANQERNQSQNTPRPAGERANSPEVTPEDRQAESEYRINAARNQQGSRVSMDAYLASQSQSGSQGKSPAAGQCVAVKIPAKSSVSERMAERNAETSKANLDAGKSVPPARTQASAEKVDAALAQERAKRAESLEAGPKKDGVKQHELTR